MRTAAIYRGALRLLPALSIFVAVDGPRSAEAASAPCIVNADGHTYDSHPSMAVAADGTTWIAWRAYHGGNDRVLLRRVDAMGNAGPIQTVSGEGRVHGPPTLVWAAQRTLWVVWSAKVGQSWQVLARCRSGEVWCDVATVSDNTNDAIYPTAVALDDKRLLVTWSARADGHFRIFYRMYEDSVWQEPAPISPPVSDAYRSVFAADGSQTAWVFWDAYDGRRYAVYGRPVHPDVGNDIDKLHRAVAQAGGLTLTQHDRFRPSGHELEVGMELVSGWGNYIARRPASFHDALNRGAHYACVANGDTHRRAPGLSGGLTGIFAEELSVEAILEALRERRCYATSGSRVFLDSRANGVLMGQPVQAVENRISLALAAVGTRPIASVTLIRNGEQLKDFPVPGGHEIRVSYEDTDLTRGRHWYLWQVSQQRVAPALPGNVSVAHGHLAWSSPHWVVVE